MDKVVEELATIENNRLFVVDNSLAQNKEWEMLLFKEMIPFKKNGSATLSKTIPKCSIWQLKQELSMYIRPFTIHLTISKNALSVIMKTVMTPFPHTKGYDDLLCQNRIFDFDWNHYNAGQVVFYPKHMTAERLQELYDYAWSTFYKDESQESKMFRLFCSIVRNERRHI